VTSFQTPSKQLSELIKKAREANDLTQAAFGKLFDPPVTQPTVGRWERGEKIPARKHFLKIASLLNFSLEELFEFVEGPLAKTGSLPVTPGEKTYIPNRKHLAIFNRGVVSWNMWREKNPEVIPELAGAKLLKQNLNGIDLSEADLREVDFSETSLANANLFMSDLRGAKLTRANFKSSDLRGANFSTSSTILINTYFISTELHSANFSDAQLKNTSFYRANLENANFNNANFRYVDLNCAVLNGANFENATLIRCLVYGISAWDVNLKGAVQKHLNICPHDTWPIYVNDLEFAFIESLIIKNHDNSEVRSAARQLQNALINERKVLLN